MDSLIMLEHLHSGLEAGLNFSKEVAGAAAAAIQEVAAGKVAGLTQAEYDALPEAERGSGMYILVPGKPSGDSEPAVKLMFSGQELALGSGAGIADQNPVGTIIASIANSIEGYLLCDGSLVKIDDYPELAELLGELGYVWDDDHVMLPDLRGRFLRGAWNDPENQESLVGMDGGEDEVRLTFAQMPPHKHEIATTVMEKTGGAYRLLAVQGDSGVIVETYQCPGLDRADPHNNIPPYMAVNWFIKAVPPKPMTVRPASAVPNIPTGGIIIWSGAVDAVPEGWALCDGENGTPDLRDRFVLGAGTSHAVGDTGGSETVTLTVEQMPSHEHAVKYASYTTSQPTGTSSMVGRILDGMQAGGSTAKSANTTSTGGSQPHKNMPPYYTLAYIMKL